MIVENIIFFHFIGMQYLKPYTFIWLFIQPASFKILAKNVMSSQLHILFSTNKVLRNKREARVDVNRMRWKCLVLPLVVGINISCCKSKVVVMPLSLTPRTITKHKQYAYGVQLAGSWQRSSGVQCVARVDNYCALLCSAPV